MFPLEKKIDDDRLIALADRAIEGRLTRQEGIELERLLDQEPGTVQRYVLYVNLHAALFGHALEDDDENGPLSRLLKEESFAARDVRRQTRILSAAAMLGALCLMFVGYHIFMRFRVVAVVTQTSPQFAWSDHTAENDGRVRIGDELRIASGFADLRFQNGAEVSLRGPALLRIVAHDAVHLDHGQILTQIPPDAAGFSVLTPDGKLVDLGTEFLVTRNAGSRTATTVRQGLVQVEGSETDSPPLRKLAANEAAIFDPGSLGWVDTPPDLAALSAFDLQALGFEVLSGDVTLLSNPRDWPMKYSDDRPGVFFIPEQQSVRLTAPVRVLGPEGKEDLLPAGTVVNSYLLDGVGNDRGIWACQASIVSKRPIGGVVVTTEYRRGSDRLVGLPSLDYSQAGNAGLETLVPVNPDRAIISPDRHRIDLSISAQSDEREQVRLFTIVDQQSGSSSSP